MRDALEDNDLDANLAGRMTAEQQVMLEQQQRFANRVVLIIIGLGVMATVLFLVRMNEIRTSRLAIPLAVNVISLPLVVWFWRRANRRYLDDLAEGRVLSHTGQASLKGKQTLVIGTMRFPQPRWLRSVERGTIYTVYYAPRSKFIVAMEKASDSPIEMDN